MKIPLGYCQCGCGKQTTISPYNDTSKGYVKGRPRRFANGHSATGVTRVGEANGRWKGDRASPSAIHKWLNKEKPLTGVCDECGVTGTRTEYSNVDHQYRRDIADYRELCSRCHRYYDYIELGTPNPCLDKAAAPSS